MGGNGRIKPIRLFLNTREALELREALGKVEETKDAEAQWRAGGAGWNEAIRKKDQFFQIHSEEYKRRMSTEGKPSVSG
jgi:hypothetical protein